MAGVEAGVDVIETSISPFANGTSQPDTIRMLALLEGHPRCPSYDVAKLRELGEYFKGVYAELSAFTSPANERVDADTLAYQVPGGMLSNFRNQLKEQGMSDQFEAVVAEIPHVRKALGYIPLVTPTSQIVGSQSMLNVKFGRWKNVSQPAMDIALGKYGKTPGPIDPDLLELVIKRSKQKPMQGRPADLLEPRMPKLRAELEKANLPTTDEACVLHAMFPQEFAALHKPAKPATPVAAPAPVSPPAVVPARPATSAGGNTVHLRLTIEGKAHEVQVQELA